MTIAEITLPWPPKKSSPNGSQGDWRGKAQAGRAYKNTCALECMAQGVRVINAETVTIIVTFHPPTLRAYDLDNALARCKRGLDAVSEALGVDDSRWREMRLVRGEKRADGAVVVSVLP